MNIQTVNYFEIGSIVLSYYLGEESIEAEVGIAGLSILRFKEELKHCLGSV